VLLGAREHHCTSGLPRARGRVLVRSTWTRVDTNGNGNWNPTTDAQITLSGFVGQMNTHDFLF